MSEQDEFGLGALITSAESEGVTDTAEWSRWISRGRAPESQDGNGFRTNWESDLDLLLGCGVRDVAVTLEWARLWPTAEKANEQEVQFRRDVLSGIRERGMAPWAVLVDGTLPGWFADDEGGFVDDRSRQLLWPRYVDWSGERFGDLVAGWIPRRESVQWALWGHLLGATPPGKQRHRDAAKAVSAAQDADLQAWRLLRGSAPVAVSHTARSMSSVPDDVKATRQADAVDDLFLKQWLHWLAEGAAREAFDVVLTQVRPPVQIDAEGAWSSRSDRDGAEPLLDALQRVAEHVGDRSLVVAADLGHRPDDGDARRDHLRELIDGARAAGAAAWWQTSPIDGWHWQHGFGVRPGLFDRDRTRSSAADALDQARPR